MLIPTLNNGCIVLENHPLSASSSRLVKLFITNPSESSFENKNLVQDTSFENSDFQKFNSSTTDKPSFFDSLKNKQVFVDFALEDRDIGIQLKKRLKIQEQLITKNAQKRPDAIFMELENKLMSCDVVILLYDKVPLGWFKERLRYYQVIQTKRSKNTQMDIVVCSSKNQPTNLILPRNTSWQNFSDDEGIKI